MLNVLLLSALDVGMCSTPELCSLETKIAGNCTQWIIDVHGLQ